VRGHGQLLTMENIHICPAFLKNYKCKRVVGADIRLKYCKPPLAAKAVSIGEERKRGRQVKAKLALLMQ
jgi:hypothetical protein